MTDATVSETMDAIIEKLLVLPDETVVVLGHRNETRIGFEREHNPFVLEWLERRRDA